MMIADLAKVLGGGGGGGGLGLSAEQVRSSLAGADADTAKQIQQAMQQLGVGGGLGGEAAQEPPTPPVTKGAKAVGMGMGTKGVGVPLEQQLHIINPCPAAVTLTATTESGPTSPSVLVVTLTGLSSALDTGAMELLVSPSEVSLRLQHSDLASPTPAPTPASTSAPNPTGALTFGVRYSGPSFRLLEGATASFKKKRGLLCVKIQYAPK
ncbi:hypothetical protein B484DRAFT_448273 [Ochromonadaceae sp. CCMP2298]|nr:hypothetical protein B484DRAFT_448273 [Ochromonadaceae sp. CCMP2298]